MMTNTCKNSKKINNKNNKNRGTNQQQQTQQTQETKNKTQHSKSKNKNHVKSRTTSLIRSLLGAYFFWYVVSVVRAAVAGEAPRST